MKVQLWQASGGLDSHLPPPLPVLIWPLKPPSWRQNLLGKTLQAPPCLSSTRWDSVMVISQGELVWAGDLALDVVVGKQLQDERPTWGNSWFWPAILHFCQTLWNCYQLCTSVDSMLPKLNIPSVMNIVHSNSLESLFDSPGTPPTFVSWSEEAWLDDMN